MSAIIGGAIVGGAALAKGIYGATQNAKASAIEKQNIRPTETVDPLYQQNVNTAEHMAQTGIPQAQYNNQVNAINRNQAGAINSLSGSANPGAGLASIVRAGNDANNNINSQDAAARNKNTLALIQQRGILANQNHNAWNYNYADKYSENLAKSQGLRGAAAQNISGAIGSVGQVATGYLGAMGGVSGMGSNAGAQGYQLSPGTAQANQIPPNLYQNFTQPEQQPYDPSIYGGASWGV